MTWKAIPFLRKLDQNGREICGFKTHECPPAIEELSEFESDLVSMIKNIQFRPARNNFLAKLKNDIKEINNTDELLVNADKSKTFTKVLKINTRIIYVITLQKLTQNLIETKSIISMMKQKLSVKN